MRRRRQRDLSGQAQEAEGEAEEEAHGPMSDIATLKAMFGDFLRTQEIKDKEWREFEKNQEERWRYMAYHLRNRKEEPGKDRAEGMQATARVAAAPTAHPAAGAAPEVVASSQAGAAPEVVASAAGNQAAAAAAAESVPAASGEAVQHPGHPAVVVDAGLPRIHQGQLSGWRGPKMQRFLEEEDIEHFLTMFERMATVSLCPVGEWAIYLVPLLTGKARAAYIAMDMDDTLCYDKVKAAILAKYEIHTETYRLRFRALEVLPEETPKELFTRLGELYEKWVAPKTHTKEQIGEKIVLEQFLRMVNADVQLWIREHNPSTAREAVLLADSFIAARRHSRSYQMGGGQEPGPPPWGKSEGGREGGRGRQLGSYPRNPVVAVGHPRDSGPGNQPSRVVPPVFNARLAKEPVVCYHCGQPGHIKPKCPLLKPKTSYVCSIGGQEGEGQSPEHQWESLVWVGIRGKRVQAMVDTGSNQTLVKANLVPKSAINQGQTLTTRCIHGHHKTYPTADLYLQIEGQEYLVTVGVLQDLPYPVVLGKDMPGLVHLLAPEKACNMVVTRAQASRDSTWDELPFAQPSTGGIKTRSQRRRDKFQGTPVLETVPVPSRDSSEQTAIPANIRELQRKDGTLTAFYRDLVEDGGGNAEGPKFRLKQGILYRHGEEGEQLVVPVSLRDKVLELGHSSPWAGHLGQNKSWERVAGRFYWPNMYMQLVQYCRSCPQCQMTAPGKKGNRAPLVPLPIIEVPFRRIAMDIVGPLERSRRGNRYILVISDYATRYPEAFPLRNVKARQVANALLQLLTRVGIPKEVLTDQGTNFTSKFLKQVYQYLGIKPIKTTPYHPQTDGLVERLNQTLKSMLRKFVSDTGADWDEWLPYLLFAYREVPQSSTGFSPFELLYGRKVRGPLDVLKEAWEGEQPEQQVNVLSYILKMRDKMEALTEEVQQNMKAAQATQKRWYDEVSRERSFTPGQKVLLLLPTSESSLLAKWQGPYVVEQKTGPVTYQVIMPERRKQRQTFHINLLKEWVPREEPAVVLFARTVEEENEGEEQFFPTRQASGVEVNVSHLSASQQEELRGSFPEGLFAETPGLTQLIHHHITLKEPGPIRVPSYRIPAQMVPKLKQELDVMKEMGIIEPSQSEWSCPIVIVPKKDGSLRFCNDLRKVNAISTFDPYPMPRVDDLLDRLGAAKWLTTLDLCKGYWQVPLAEETKPLTAFRTPFGFFQYTVMPFGLKGAPATFQRLMDGVLEGAWEYAGAYLDDVVIFSATWEEHLVHVRDVFQRIKDAGLTINPAKCSLAKSQVEYLGFIIGSGVVRPQVGKVSALTDTPVPKTKSQVRSFLGMVGWYRRFIPNCSSRAAVLTELTKKDRPNRVRWTDQCQRAFEDLRDCLCTNPVLQQPDFNLPFTVQTDASGVGLGAVLLQGEEGNQRPVTFLSRKLFPRECKYSTVEKECLGLKWALDSLHYYLVGKSFTIETDHRALQWLQRMKDTNHRITRWYLALQPYQFQVKYRPGAQNVTADYLSRVFEDENA